LSCSWPMARPSKMHTSRKPVLVSIVVAALSLRLLFLDAQPLWWDEGYSVYFSTEPLGRLIALTSFDIHPPLYYVFLKAWFALVGVSPVRARLLSVLLGVLAVRLMWSVAHRLSPRPVAVVATVLLATSPLHIYYSQEVRMYALLTLLALAGVNALLEACQTGRRRQWAWLVVLATATMLTQYYGAFVVVALALTWWWLRRSATDTFPHAPAPKAAARWAIALGALYAPWAIYAGPRLYEYVVGKVAVEADRPLSAGVFALRHAVAFSVGHLMPQQAPLAAWALLFVVLALVGTWHGWRRARWQTGVLLLWLAVPAAGTFLVNLVAPFTDPRIERQLIAALPPFLLLVAWGVEAIRRLPLTRVTQWHRLSRWGGIPAAFTVSLLLLVANALSLAGFYTIPRYPEDDYRPLLAHVAAVQGPQDAWLAVYPWQIGYLRAYLPKRRPAEVTVPLDWAEDAEARRAGVRALYARFRRLWFPAFQVKGRVLEERLAATLRQEGVPVWDEWYGTTRLWLTARADVDAESEPLVSFSGGGTLRRVAYRASPVPSGVGVVPVVLTWDGPTDNRRLNVQLVGPQGTVWGEFDAPLEAPETRAGVPVEPGTPPLRYTLRLTLYRADTGRPYDVLDEAGNPVAPSYSLGELTVTRPPEPLPPAALPIQRPVALSFGDEVRLLGASLVTDTVRTGDVLPVTLFWQALRDVQGEYLVILQAIDEVEGEIQGAREAVPVMNTFPTSMWQQGEIVRDPHPLVIDATAPPGRYRLIAGLYDPVAGERLRTRRGADHAVVGTFTVEPRPHLFEPPPVAQPLEVSFGQIALLTGVTLTWPGPAGEVRAGETVEITLVWQPQTTPEGPVRTFVQLLGPDNVLVANSDHVPGQMPATAWVPGEYIVDPHALTVPQEAPPGTYRLIAGIYDASSGQRFLTAEGTDVVELATVDITRP